MSEYDDNPSMMQSSCACACASSEKIALTRVVGLEYLLITWWIFFSRPLNRLQLSGRGWGCTTAVAGHSPTSDDHWKPPSTVCVRVCWNSWIREWRVWCMSDRIQTISNWIQDMYWTGFKTWYIRSDPRYVSYPIQDMYQIESKICIRLDPRYVSYWIQDMHQIGPKIWIRLDPRYVSDRIQDMCQIGSEMSLGTPVQCVSPALSLVPASAFVTWPSCHVPLSHANVKACREMWRNVTTCHDVVTFHGMSFRAPACAATVIPPDIYLASHLW